MFIGIGLSITGGRRTGVSAPRIKLSPRTVAENAEAATPVGTASISGTYTGTPEFTLAGDDAAFFALDPNTGELTVDDDIDFEEDGPTLDITIGVSGIDPIPAINPRPFTITVTNVLEVTLNALTLDNDEIEEGTSDVVGEIVGKSSGSTVEFAPGGDLGGLATIDGLNVEVDATGLVPDDYEITLREAHPDGSNSPRDSVISITVTEAGMDVFPDNNTGASEYYYFIGM